MKNNLIFFVIVFFVSICINSCIIKETKSEHCDNNCDSVNYISSSKSTFILNKNQNLVTYYYEIIRIDNFKFFFLYDYDETYGKIYEHAYIINIDNNNKCEFFTHSNKVIYTLKVCDSIIVDVNNNTFKILRYEDLDHSGYYHYLNEKLGFLALENDYEIRIVEKNSKLTDSDCSKISNKIIEYIRQKMKQ
jgi:hypothetical protein